MEDLQPEQVGEFRAFVESFRQQAKEMLKNRAELSAAREGEEDQYATANTEFAVADSGQHFCISGADVIDGEREELPHYMLDNVLHQGFAFTPLPTASRYAMAYEGTSSLSPREFWLKLLSQKDTELLGIEVKAKSVVEIDDGLAPCFFFKTEEGYTRCQCFDADRARTNCMEGWEEYNQEDIK